MSATVVAWISAGAALFGPIIAILVAARKSGKAEATLHERIRAVEESKASKVELEQLRGTKVDASAQQTRCDAHKADISRELSELRKSSSKTSQLANWQALRDKISEEIGKVYVKIDSLATERANSLELVRSGLDDKIRVLEQSVSVLQSGVDALVKSRTAMDDHLMILMSSSQRDESQVTAMQAAVDKLEERVRKLEHDLIRATARNER